jgi:hypothetical protein
MVVKKQNRERKRMEGRAEYKEKTETRGMKQNKEKTGMG